ncbi:TIGR03862 family flavoprotein [Marinomonas sp.]
MPKKVIVIGAGPAGLMAAERICAQGYQVHVYDAKPSACRKFLLAGVGGMNITHSEPYDAFIQRYYDKANWLDRAISQFDADTLQDWIHGLGIETFIGSSGRIFPKDMKAAPLLRNWLKRLREMGVVFHMRQKMLAIESTYAVFSHDNQETVAKADAFVLAMGGASWPKLGSDGRWQQALAKHKVVIEPLKSANCGFYSPWSNFLKEKFAGSPLKGVAFRCTTIEGVEVSKKGECILTQDGMEGSLIYAFSKYLRDQIEQRGQAQLVIDLLPQLDHSQLVKKLSHRKAKESFSKYIKRTLNLGGVKVALLHEVTKPENLSTPEKIAASLKRVVVHFDQVKAIEEVISSAGGVCEESVTEHLMLKNIPGIFCAGEMLDWEAPTGGYLLTACFATGVLAAQGVEQYLQS